MNKALLIFLMAAGALGIAVAQPTAPNPVPNIPSINPVPGVNYPAVASSSTSSSVVVTSLPPLPAGSSNIGSVSVGNFPATQPISGSVSVSNLPTTQPISGAVTVSNLPATQPISGNVGISALPALPAGNNAIGTVGVSSFPQAARSGAWTDASATVTTSAATPSGLGAVSARTGLHLWNVGSNLVCMNYTNTATVSGTACAVGSVPLPAGASYLEDQPGNVSPEAISLIAVGGSSSVTIKVR